MLVYMGLAVIIIYCAVWSSVSMLVKFKRPVSMSYGCAVCIQVSKFMLLTGEIPVDFAVLPVDKKGSQDIKNTNS